MLPDEFIFLHQGAFCQSFCFQQSGSVARRSLRRSVPVAEIPQPVVHSLESDGGAAHGTGLRLVAQIAAAHGGKAVFCNGTPYRCELWLPV